MNAWRFILGSLRHYRRIHIAVMLGVAVATAVLTGALLVGDSERGSLRDLTLERLGRIDTVLLAQHPFRAALASELAASKDFQSYFFEAEPALLSNGSLQAGSGKTARRATNISVVGITPGFWSLGEGGPEKELGADEVAITDPIARELGVHVGDDILVRVPVATAIPADSTLGKKSDTSLTRNLKVGAVLPINGLARFGVIPSQQQPRNLFVSLATVQMLIKQPGKANLVLMASERAGRAQDANAQESLMQSLKPQLEDYGVTVSKETLP